MDIYRQKSMFLLGVLLLILTAACGDSQQDSNEHPRLVIAVVGDGVPPINTTAQRIIPLNRSQGNAMFNGVKAALDHSPRLAAIRSLVKLEGRDDVADSRRSIEIAREIRKDPRVLAVIGHATSESTKAAVEIYDSVGIPLFMPIATSPKVMQSANGEHRYTHAFRLPPSDDKAQAPAVAYMARKLNSRRIALIQDLTSGAQGYSETLTNSVRPLLASESIVYFGYANRGGPNLVEIASSIRSNAPDLIVFCGYGSTAIELLNALRDAYAEQPVAERPKLLLTDGCLVTELNASGFITFVTFPHATIRPPVTPEDRADIQAIRAVFGSRDYYSYEVFGYDAMLILGEAIKSCMPSGINRSCVTRSFDRPEAFIGMLGAYDFEDGENTLSSYDILYNSPIESATFRPMSRETIDRGTLAAIRAGKAFP
jgi:ABC-type branched-subunit amino acid transport system substrate-binding protein